jgi:hypothetical protein
MKASLPVISRLAESEYGLYGNAGSGGALDTGETVSLLAVYEHDHLGEDELFGTTSLDGLDHRPSTRNHVVYDGYAVTGGGAPLDPPHRAVVLHLLADGERVDGAPAVLR